MFLLFSSYECAYCLVFVFSHSFHSLRLYEHVVIHHVIRTRCVPSVISDIEAFDRLLSLHHYK